MWHWRSQDSFARMLYLLTAFVATVASADEGRHVPTAPQPTAQQPDLLIDPADVFVPDDFVPMGDVACYACDETSVHSSLWTRSRLTGDWLGLRNGMEEDGITFNLYGTQFYQGIASGGRSQEREYGGKFDYLAHFNGKSIGNPGLFVDLHGESRLGTSVNLNDGLITPSNIAMNFPLENGNVSALTGLKVTQALSENFVVSLARSIRSMNIHFDLNRNWDSTGPGSADS